MQAIYTKINMTSNFKIQFERFPDSDGDVSDKASAACWETLFPGTDAQWFVRLYGTDQDVYDAFEAWTKSGKRGTVVVTTFLPNGEVCLEKQFDVSAKTIGPMLLSSRESASYPEYEVEFDVIKEQN
jgi:hypothetical protein